MKNKFKAIFLLCLCCLFWATSSALASACKVTEDADNKSSSDTLRYVVEEFLYDRSDTPCSSGSTDSGAGYEQTVKFDPTTGSSPVRSIVLSKVLKFDVRDAAGPVVVGNSTSQGYALIDGSGVTEKPLQCEEGSDDVYLRNLVIITDGIDQEMLLADSCLKAEDEFYVCDSKDDYDAGVEAGLTPGEDGWCGGGLTAEVGPMIPFDALWEKKYEDADEDGFGDPEKEHLCFKRTPFIDLCENYVDDNTDCDDTVYEINPAAEEICDGIDNNCDGQIDEGFDEDGDGVTTCEGDCDDTDATAYPSAEETCGDGIDQDCDGSDTECAEDDADGDGYTEDQNDCDDANADINPGEIEVCDDIDNNCDGNVDGGNVCDETDADGDGYISEDTGGDDCDDTSSTIYPGATEICGDSIDQDCDGVDATCEICDSDVDNDGDGLIGCDDPDCITDPLCSITVQETECADGIDNDSDGSIDCADSDCYNVVIDDVMGTTCANMAVGIVGDGGNVLGGANLVGGCTLGGFAGQGGSAGLWWLIVVLAFVRQRSSTK